MLDVHSGNSNHQTIPCLTRRRSSIKKGVDFSCNPNPLLGQQKPWHKCVREKGERERQRDREWEAGRDKLTEVLQCAVCHGAGRGGDLKGIQGK